MVAIFYIFLLTSSLFAHATGSEVRSPRTDVGDYDFGLGNNVCDFDEVKGCIDKLRNQNKDIKECLIEHDEEVADDHEMICSKLERLEGSIGSSSEVSNSQIIAIEESLCEKIETIDDNLISTTDEIVSSVDVTESILCEKLEDLDQDLSSSSDTIISHIDVVQSLFCSKIEELGGFSASPCCDVLITQSMIPFTISTPGAYCVAENLSLSVEGTVITIDSDNVTLDLCGHVIAGDNESEATGIFCGGEQSKIVIKNGYICDFEFGIDFDTVALFTIKNIGIIPSTEEELSSVVGLRLDSCLAGMVSNVFVTNLSQNSIAVGIKMSSTASVMLFDCGVTNNNIGFCLEESQNNFFKKCFANNNRADGFSISNSESDSGNNVFKCCIANNNGTESSGDGFIISASNNNVFRNCFAESNARDGFNVSGQDNEVTSCSTIDNGRIGIFDTPNTNQHIYNNRSESNTTDDYSRVEVIIPSLSVTASTGFWSNISS